MFSLARLLNEAQTGTPLPDSVCDEELAFLQRLLLHRLPRPTVQGLPLRIPSSAAGEWPGSGLPRARDHAPAHLMPL